MTPFKQFNARLQAHVKQLTKNVNTLFTIALDKDELWNVYLDSFPEGTNPMYRKRREFDCSCCRHFVKAFGNVVSLDGGVVTTIWDFDAGDSDMQAAGLGTPIEREELRRGDLVFWKGHVAIMEDEATIIHANGHTMSVAREPLAAAIERTGYLYQQPTGYRRPV